VLVVALVDLVEIRRKPVIRAQARTSTQKALKSAGSLPTETAPTEIAAATHTTLRALVVDLVMALVLVELVVPAAVPLVVLVVVVVVVVSPAPLRVDHGNAITSEMKALAALAMNAVSPMARVILETSQFARSAKIPTLATSSAMATASMVTSADSLTTPMLLTIAPQLVLEGSKKSFLKR